MRGTEVWYGRVDRSVVRDVDTREEVTIPEHQRDMILFLSFYLCMVVLQYGIRAPLATGVLSALVCGSKNVMKVRHLRLCPRFF